MASPLGFILAEGPSRFDGTPIVAVATGIGRRSKNRKTGAVVQVYVLRADRLPSEALATNADKAVCGNCVHRGNGLGTCYVDLVRGADIVWLSLQKARYPRLGTASHRICQGLCFRVTAYGDCAALPFDCWEPFLSLAQERGCTVLGYTHQWRHCDPAFQRFCMASVESVADQREAVLAGWRTFRIRLPGSDLQDNEFQCPADSHADVMQLCGVPAGSTTCDNCRRCNGGAVGQNISLYPHGVNFKKTQLTEWLERGRG